MPTLKSEVEELKRQLVEMAEQLETISSKSEDSFKDELQDYFDSAKETLQEKLARAKEKSREGSEQVQEFVKENPWQVVGVAAALGFLAAMLLTKDEK